jgi:hypothetical protein
MDYFCADGILYHGNYITVLWDRTGERYSLGKGLHVWYNGTEISASENLKKIQISLPK